MRAIAPLFAGLALVFLGAVLLTIGLQGRAPASVTPAPAFVIPSASVSHAPIPARKPLPSRAPATRAPASAASVSPGAFCATWRLGEHGTYRGQAYECRGPKPYRWRHA